MRSCARLALWLTILTGIEKVPKRLKVTRALCAIGLLEPITLAGAFVVLFLVGSGVLAPFESPQALSLLLIIFAPKLVAVSLSLWRHCDRCSKQLFADRHIWPQRQRRHDAQRVWGSFRYAAMLEYVRTGTTHCMWCGHRDGAKPDYVVVSSIV